MKIRNFVKISFAASIIAALSQNSLAKEPLADDINRFNIAGIQVEDKLEAVIQSLIKAGYSPDAKKSGSPDGIRKGPSFEQFIQIAREEITYREAKDSVSAVFYSKGQETISVQFKSFPGGHLAAATVSYQNFSPTATVENIAPKAILKYGEPDRRNKNFTLTWSDKPLDGTHCGNLHPTAICLTLTEFRSSKLSIMLGLGGGENSRFEPAREAQKRATTAAPDTTF